MNRSLVVVGDCLLDRDLVGHVERMSPEAPVPVVEELSSRPRPGGAGLAAALAARGREVRLITALARDPAAEELRSMLAAAGVEVIDLGLSGTTPEKVRVRSNGRTLLRLDYGGRRGPSSREAIGAATADALGSLAGGGAILVSDYGQGMTAEPAIRRALARASASVPIVWDPHPRGSAPVPGAQLVKPNRREAGAGATLGETARLAQQLRARWRSHGVVITLGEQGALLATADPVPLVVPAPQLSLMDTSGAGDRFSAAAAGLLADGAGLAECVTGAVHAASAFVAAGGASASSAAHLAGADLDDPENAWGMERALMVAAETRARGGRVVATGGCFDLLHAGHVSTLSAARALGDCLIVFLNSDMSVRRLKGPRRPVVPEADRAAVLAALGSVDAVVTFDEPTPAAVLRRLRPDVFAKGGDYAGQDIAERSVVAEWGGDVVLLPYLEGRSTSRLVREVLQDAG